MSQQDGTPSSTQQRRSHKTNTANQENSKQIPAAQRPANDDTEAWKSFWKAQGQPWRTEPEIDEERQRYLDERRSIKPDWKQGIFPFKDIKLSRADVEWLLATHENGCVPVDWSDERQQQREGLDLRGANLRRAELSGLPLARMRGGLTPQELFRATEEQRNMAAAQLQEASLWQAQLQKAYLGRAQLQGADLQRADLEDAKLDGVTLSDQTYGSARLADMKWGEVNLAIIDWGHVTRLGDEQVAQQEKDTEGKIKDKQTRVNEYKGAVRANQQLAVVLREQGL